MFKQHNKLAAAIVAAAGLMIASASQAQSTTQNPPPAKPKAQPATPAASAPQTPAAPQGPPQPQAPPQGPRQNTGPGQPGGMGPGKGMGPGLGMGRGMGMGPGMWMGFGQGRGMGRGVGAGAAMRGQLMRQRRRAMAAGNRVMRQLDLTRAQRDQLTALRDQQQKDRQAIGERMKIARQKLRDAMKADIPDEAAVKAAAGAIAAARGDQFALQARARAQMMKMLTPEQQTQLNDLRGRMNRLGARRMQGGPSMMWRRQMMRRMNPLTGVRQPLRPRMIRPWRNWI